MTYSTGLTTKGNIWAGVGGTGDACLSNDKVSRANMAVVANMNQIVNLSALANNGGANGSTVNAGMGTDFHIILQHYIAYLWHLGMNAILAGKAKAICTNYSRAMDNNPLTYLAVLTDGGTGIDNGILANNSILANIGMRIKGNAILNDSMVIYKGHWHNGNILANNNILTDMCLRTYALLMDNRRRKEG